MTRRPYVERADRGPPVHPSEIRSGCYLTRLVRAGPLVPVLIAWDHPRDPATAEILDRSQRWIMCLDGSWTDARGELWDEAEILHVFLFSARRPITGEEYAYRLARQQHAIVHEPDLPEAQPRKPVSHNKLPPTF